MRLTTRMLLLMLCAAAAGGCGTMRAVGSRLFHGRRCNECTTCESTPMGVPIMMPQTVLPPGVVIDGAGTPIVTGAPVIAAPPAVVNKLPAEEVVEPEVEEEEPALPPVIHPTPPPRQSQSAKPAETEPTPPPTALKSAPPTPEPAPPPPARPGGLTLNVTSDKAILAVGDEVVFDLVLRNQGGSPIESVEFSATLSDNLRPKRVTPERTGTIRGNTVTFNPVTNFTPMSLSYQIVAEAIATNGQSGRITIEAKSPILTAGPLKQESVVRITPKK